VTVAARMIPVSGTAGADDGFTLSEGAAK
jgi:hypothetical protein